MKDIGNVYKTNKSGEVFQCSRFNHNHNCVICHPLGEISMQDCWSWDLNYPIEVEEYEKETRTN